MREKRNESNKDKKIVSFDFTAETMEDPELDDMIKKSIMDEADRIEEELNSDPSLDDLAISDDLFASIVGKLKESGDWEEDEETNLGEEGSGIQIENDMPEEKSDAVKEKEPLSSETVYALLSEEDKEALELGRAMRQRKQEKEKKRRGRQKIYRYSGIAAAMLVVIFSVGMSSEANRRLVLKVWNGIWGELGFKVNTDYLNDENSVENKNEEKIAALEDIRETMGIAVIDFPEIPKGMEYEGYDILGDNMEAEMRYSYNGYIFHVSMINAIQEGSFYYMTDERSILLEDFVTEQRYNAKIWKINADESRQSYLSEIDLDGVRYILNGIVSYEEIKKITNFSIIL